MKYVFRIFNPTAEPDEIVLNAQLCSLLWCLIPVRDNCGLLHQAFTATKGRCNVRDSKPINKPGSGLQVSNNLKTDNTTNKNIDQLGYTNASVYPHTDQPFIENPPGLQMLHCITPADQGGENSLVDAKQAVMYLKSIDPHAYNLLTTVPVKFHRKQKNFESVTKYPLIQMVGEDFQQIRYSYFTYAPFSVPFEWMEDWYRAYNTFAKIVRDRNFQYFFRLNSGDYLLYNNFTMLHARETFYGNRHVRGIYYDHKAVFQKLKEYN